MKKIISLILAFAMIFTLSLALVSCGGRDACAHLEERDVTGRDIHFVEMSVKHCGKTAKMGNQFSCQRVGIFARHGIIQQQFQCLIICERI